MSAPAIHIWSAIRLLYGKEFAENLIEFTEELPDLKVYGLLGKPEFTKPNREYQLFFLNQRPIRSRIIGAALTESLDAMVAKGRQPVALLFLTLDPETVDVNVHPAKIEVRFRNERTIYSGIVRILRNAVHKAKYIPKIETPVPNRQQSEGRHRNPRYQSTRSDFYTTHISPTTGRQRATTLCSTERSKRKHRLFQHKRNSGHRKQETETVAPSEVAKSFDHLLKSLCNPRSRKSLTV